MLLVNSSQIGLSYGYVVHILQSMARDTGRKVLESGGAISKIRSYNETGFAQNLPGWGICPKEGRRNQGTLGGFGQLPLEGSE